MDRYKDVCRYVDIRDINDKVDDTLLKMVGDNLNLFHALGQDINNTADVYIT